MGLFGGGSTWPIALIPMKALSIIGSYVGNLAELKELMELVRAGKVPPMPVHRYALDQADSVLASLRAGKVVGRAVLTTASASACRGQANGRGGGVQAGSIAGAQSAGAECHIRHRRLRPNDSSNPGPAMTDRQLTILAALNLMVAVGAGAFGAHGLKRIVSPELLAVWQTGVLYHLIHALGILAVALLGARYGSPLLSAAGLVMFAGIVLFRQPVSARADRHALAGRGHAAGRRRLPGLLGHGCAGRLPQPG